MHTSHTRSKGHYVNDYVNKAMIRYKYVNTLLEDGSAIGGAMNDRVLTLAFPFQWVGFDVTASLNYVTLVSDDIRRTDAYGRGRDDSFYAVISLAKAF